MAELTAEKESRVVVGKKLYVGSLPYTWSVEQLESLFAPFGRVSSTAIVSDMVTKKSKGFGFVEMDNEDSAKKAMDELNGREVEGRPLTVREAKPNMEKRSRGEDSMAHKKYEYSDQFGTDTSGRSYGNRNGWW
jgi:RNA recognition motif-containing protein